MSEDFGAAVVDAASAVESTPVTTNDSAVETPSTSGSDDLQVIDDSSEHEGDSAEKESLTHNSDGSEKTPEQIEDAKAKAENRAPMPSEVRVALKALKDLDPKNAAVVRQLHGHFERFEAIREALGASGPNGLKSLLSENSVQTVPQLRETLANHNKMIEAVGATDELLYVADPVLSQNVYDDMQAQGKEGMYGKVVSNFVQHLKEADATAYYDQVAKPLFLQGMDEAGMPGALNSLHKALLENDMATAKAITKNIADFYVNLRDEQGESAKISKERAAWEAEKTTKETASQKAERNKVEHGVAEECEKSSNVELGKFLGGFLRLPFFKDWPRETKIDLGNGIKEKLYSSLKADKQYQLQMDSLWKGKIIDRAKMVQVHTAWLQQHGDALVRGVVQNRYPGYAKGGSAAGRVASATASKTAATKAAASSISTGKPIYVAARPTNIVHSDIKVGGRTYTSNDLQVLQIAGKGFVKTTDGKSVKFVTWRKN